MTVATTACMSGSIVLPPEIQLTLISLATINATIDVSVLAITSTTADESRA